MAKIKVELTQEQKEYNQWFNDLMDDKSNDDNSKVENGIYDISNIEYFLFRGGYSRPAKKDEAAFRIFAEKYPNFVIAEPYQTEQIICLSEKPTIELDTLGTDFTHGANAIIDNCPKRILICAQND